MECKKGCQKVLEILRNLMIKGKYDEALKIYLQNIKEFRNEPDIRNIGGDIFNRLNRIDDAITEYERCEELYRERKLYANAIAICKKVLRIAPQYDLIYSILGDIYMEAGLVGESILNHLKYAEKKKKSSSHFNLKEIFNKIVEIFGEENKILLQTLPVFPEAKKEFENFLKMRGCSITAQKRDLIEKIKRDPEYETFERVVEMELYRSRRYVRPFSIFTIELSFLRSKDESCLEEMEKLFGILKNNLRTIDYIFLNADGFFYGLLPETSSDGVFILSDRLVNRMKDLCKDRTDISMKWSTYPKDGQKTEELLEALEKSGQVCFQ
ncbi:MAG: hypothetical protein E3J87_08350 [Candidatus Cloacimonadota bacterium]|nr:MAG: hypothetical protein E3J87_08350 [Candidatus Cloacimonadota bacterium]